MGYAVCTRDEFVAALVAQGWTEDALTPPETAPVAGAAYSYEEDTRPIWWVFFTSSEEGIPCALHGTGQWHDYVSHGEACACGGVLDESFWMKPNGLVVSQHATETIATPYGIPLREANSLVVVC